jgi:hypothetical protein
VEEYLERKDLYRTSQDVIVISGRGYCARKVLGMDPCGLRGGRKLGDGRGARCGGETLRKLGCRGKVFLAIRNTHVEKIDGLQHPQTKWV